MKFCVEWLQELTGLEQPVEELAQVLTRIGLAVDTIEDQGGDAVFDVDVPSNRVDCLGYRGVARELSAALGGRLQTLDIDLPPEAGGGPPPVAIEIADPNLCRRYSARCLKGVRVGTSPEWMARRLERSGVRPLNTIVDITNYVMLETGQPLHAFDQSRLDGNRLSVREARKGEKLTTLDGTERRLSSGHLIIADARRPVALAGLMGGLDTEIRADTQDIVIESARFAPLAIRRTARALGMRTEGSQRFERGTDPGGTLRAADRAATLMARLAGAQVDAHAVDLYPVLGELRRLRLRHDRVKALLGMAIPPDQMRSILERLEFCVLSAEPSHLEIEVPSFRSDVECEEDLVEEVARHHGYDLIPSTLPEARDSSNEVLEATRGQLTSLLSSLQAHGFTEGICTVFVESNVNHQLMDGSDHGVRLVNPLSETGDELRCSLLPGLVAAARRNLNHGAPGVALYETGVVFRTCGADAKPNEEIRLALVMAGTPSPGSWDRRPSGADLFDVKGALEEGLERAGWPSLETRSTEVAWLRPGRTAQLLCGEQPIGWMGALHPDTAAALDVDAEVMTAEISLTELERVPTSPHRYRTTPRTPPVTRDLALVMPRQQAFAEVADAIRKLDSRIVRVEPFDRYESKKLGPNHISLALRVTFHHPERTLLSEEVQELEDQILSQLNERFKIRLRGT